MATHVSWRLELNHEAAKILSARCRASQCLKVMRPSFNGSFPFGRTLAGSKCARLVIVITFLCATLPSCRRRALYKWRARPCNDFTRPAMSLKTEETPAPPADVEEPYSIFTPTEKWVIVSLIAFGGLFRYVDAVDVLDFLMYILHPARCPPTYIFPQFPHWQRRFTSPLNLSI